MRKYLFIYKSELMTNLQYVFNIVVGFITYFILMLIFLNLWKYVYSDPNEIINGYSMSQMVWYVIVTELLWSVLGGRKLCAKICEDVRSGNIAYNINKPYSYIGYSLSGHLGLATLKAFMLVVLGCFLGFIFLGEFPVINFLGCILVLISIALATVISSLLIIGIGLLSFFIEDANPFYWLYSKFILVLGVMFPIEYFPQVLQPILNFSPIYVVSYGPAKLFVDFSYMDAFKILGAQMIYVIIGYLLCSVIYNKGVKKLNVNGG